MAASSVAMPTDVWDPEPPPDDDPLDYDDERVLVTPHIAALTDRTYREICPSGRGGG